ncbi:FAD-dependent oxidoreductase [Streptomyces sp. NBC_01474]|uniref:FAD-dependent oxidoreductase n=1 Tax=unclassified Streptomyces TaxID=2593676 RepID=UPI002DDAE892|nr:MULTISPECIES: FAD-dependent oxidoreductase [unclassified Streptomyces]WSD94795.1 FAD-dependent oxidoreductase [Streptomyces sp. NBC_01474]
MPTPRIAVIGTGTIGAQTLWQLAKHGADVTGYELFSPGHSRGAAGGETRLFRHIDVEHLEYLAITDRADLIWRELEEESGHTLRNLTGALAIGSTASPATHTALKSAALLGSRAEVLSREETQLRFPQYRLHEDEIAILDKGAGIIFPERTVRTAADAAVARGARILRECRVTAINQVGSQVDIVTGDGTEHYDRVVVAAGAWTATLLPDMAPYLATRRLISSWYLPKAGSTLDGMLPYLRTEPDYSYGLPTADGLAMKLGVGFRDHLPVESPDTAPLRITDEDLEPIRAVARDLFPILEDYPMRAQAYFAAYTHSRIEFMREHPSMPSVFVCAGFSGKGFKNAPVFGELAARAVLGLPPKNDSTAFILNAEHPTRSVTAHPPSL